MAELFAQHEINRASLWPRLSKVVVGSLVFHLLLGVTLKYVPVARGIFSIAGSASDMGFVDGDYERIASQDEVIFLTLQGGKFQYPNGFFSAGNIAAPPLPPVLLTAPAPPTVPLSAPVKLPPIAQLPTPAPLPVGTPVLPAGKSTKSLPPLPGAAGQIAKNLPPQSTPTPAPSPTPALSPKEAADKALDKIAAEKKIIRPRRNQIVTTPFNELWGRINAVKEQQPLDLDKDAELTLTAQRMPDNTLKLSAPEWKGDPQLARVLNDFLIAASNSKALDLLEGATQYHFNFKFAGPQFNARIEAQVPSPERAKELAQAYSAMLFTARIYKKGDEEEVYLNNAKISAEGQSIIINFALPREETKALLNKQLASAADKAQTKQQPTQTPLK